MECLNTDNAAAKKNLGKKRRAVGVKPDSLHTGNMKKPVVSAAADVDASGKENDAG